ncbi:MAG: alpha/beta hydrolase [Hyphomonadaceae bacterium]|nr:alpha/beta hydrolase [Hyphomonadaceae bacterium]
MKRRGLLIGALLALAACASAPEAGVSSPQAGFTSDRISVVTRGAGRDVILIPGLSSSRDVWNTTADALDENYRVHLVQLNGFAGAPVGANADGPVSAPVAEEIARYISENHLNRPAVIGHSMGGSIGMMLAARHPDAVGKLMVVDMFPFMGAMFGGPNATPETVAPIADQIRGAMRMAPQGVVSDQTRGMITSMVRTETARPEIIEHARQSNVGVTANAFHELIVTDLRPELANIRAPLTVLYVIPPQAPITPEQYDGFMRASYASVPTARIVKIEDSYHFIMIDQFDRFMREVNTFLVD